MAADVIDILSAVVTRSSTDLSLTRVSRDDDLNIPNKATTGRPTQFFLDRQVTPSLRIWPTPDNSTDVIVYNALTRIDDGDTAINTMDVPFRFYPCLTAGLSYYIAIKRAPDKVQLLKSIYEEEFQRASAEDRDRATLTITPSSVYYGLI